MSPPKDMNKPFMLEVVSQVPPETGTQELPVTLSMPALFDLSHADPKPTMASTPFCAEARVTPNATNVAMQKNRPDNLTKSPVNV